MGIFSSIGIRQRNQRYARPVVETLEERVVPDARTFGGLEFLADGTFQASPSKVAVQGRVEVGVAPQNGAPFTPVIELTKGVSFDPADVNALFTTSGAVSAIASGQSIPFLDNHKHTFSALDLLSAAGDTLPATDVNAARVPVAGVNLAVNNLAFTDSALDLRGTITIPGLAGVSLTVSGQNDVVIDSTGVQLAGASLPVTSKSFTVGGATVSSKSLSVSYTSANDTFTFTGNATITIPQVITGAAIDLGGNGTAGLVVKDGSVVELDGVITATKLTVGNLTLVKPAFEFDYQAATQQFGLSGLAGVQVAAIKGLVHVQLGDAANPGILIQNGAITQFDFTVVADSTFTLAGLTIDSKSLTGTYTPTTNLFAFSGDAQISVGATIQNVPMSLGTASQAGFTIKNGILTSFAGSIDGPIQLAGTTIQPVDLEIVYNAVTQRFGVSGAASINFGAATLDADLGTFLAPGLVIGGSAVKSASIGLSGAFNLFSMDAHAQKLAIHLDVASQRFVFGGSVTIALTPSIQGVFSISRDGLFINPQTGKFDVTIQNGLSLRGNVDLGDFAARDVNISYTKANGQISMKATANIAFPGGFSVPASLLFNGAGLSDIKFKYAGGQGIALGNSGLFLTTLAGDLTGLDDPTQIAFSGEAIVASPASSVWGGGHRAVSATGIVTLTAQDFSVTGDISLVNGVLGTGKGILDLDWADDLYSIKANMSIAGGIFDAANRMVIEPGGDIVVMGVADVTIPTGLASTFYAKLNVQPGATLDALPFFMAIRPGLPLKDTLGAAWIDNGGQDTGIMVTLGGMPYILKAFMGTPVADGFTNQLSQGAEKVIQHLAADGHSLDDQGGALENGFNMTPLETMQVLKAANHGANDVGQVLKDVYQLDAADTVATLKTAYSAADASDVLVKIFQDTDATVAGQLLAQAGYSISDTTGAMAKKFKQSANQAYSILINAFANIDAAIAAKGLKDGGYGTFDVGAALKQLANLSVSDVIKDLKQAGYTVTQISQILNAIYGADAQDAADDLNTDGQFAASDVANAMKSVYDQVDLDTVSVLKNAGFTADDVATALQKVYATNAQQMASLMQQTGYDASDMASVQKGIFKKKGPDALQDMLGAGLGLGDAMQQMKALYQWKEQEITQAMHANRADVNTIASILDTQFQVASTQALTLLQAIGATQAQQVAALKSVYGMSASEIAESLRLNLKVSDAVAVTLLNQAGFQLDDLVLAVAGSYGDTAGEMAMAIYRVHLSVAPAADALSLDFALSDAATGAVMHRAGWGETVLHSLGDDYTSAFGSASEFYNVTI